MSERADYKLRHGVFGMLGSFWSKQLSAESKTQARTLAATAGSSERLQRLDSTVNYLSSARRVTVENETFNFIDGDFCYVGQDFLAYARTELEAADGAEFTFSRRDPLRPGTSSSSTPRPAVLSSLSAEFVASVRKEVSDGKVAFSNVSDVFLIPIPKNLTPVTITSRVPGLTLVAGIDFTAHDGYIALRDNPAELLSSGSVVMPLAILELDPPNSYSLRADSHRYGNTFLAKYSSKSGSIRAFRQAAAEYAGIWVIERDDVVLSKKVTSISVTYVMMSAGVVVVDYPHEPLSVGQGCAAGLIVSRRFDMIDRASSAHSALIAGNTRVLTSGVSLDGVLSVKGLSFFPAGNVRVNYAEISLDGRCHARLHVSGPPVAVSKFWSQQAQQERDTGVYLSDALGLSEQTPEIFVDLGQLLEALYGDSLLLVVLAAHTSKIDKRLLEFIRREKPLGCVVLTCLISSSSGLS